MHERSCYTLNPKVHRIREGDWTGFTNCCNTQVHCVPGNHMVTTDRTKVVTCRGKTIPYYVLIDGRDALQAGFPEEKKFIRNMNNPVTMEEFIVFLRRVPDTPREAEMLWINPLLNIGITEVTYEIFDEMFEYRKLAGVSVNAQQMADELEERIGDDLDLLPAVVCVSNTVNSFPLTRQRMFRIMYQILEQSAVNHTSFIPEDHLPFAEGYLRFLEEMQYPVVSDDSFTQLMYPER